MSLQEWTNSFTNCGVSQTRGTSCMELSDLWIQTAACLGLKVVMNSNMDYEKREGAEDIPVAFWPERPQVQSYQ